MVVGRWEGAQMRKSSGVCLEERGVGVQEGRIGGAKGFAHGVCWAR